MRNITDRPTFLNLLQIHLPVTALLSIAHRLTGVLLVLSIPAQIWLLDLSLAGPEGHARAAALLHQPGMRLALLFGLWALIHHLLAGLRFLAIDLDWGASLPTARGTAWAVNFGAPLLALLVWVLL